MTTQRRHILYVAVVALVLAGTPSFDPAAAAAPDGGAAIVGTGSVQDCALGRLLADPAALGAVSADPLVRSILILILLAEGIPALRRWLGEADP
jgi:hypothetical protein